MKKQRPRATSADLAKRVRELTTRELRVFMHEALGVECHDAEAAIRTRLLQDAQELFCAWAVHEMKRSLGVDPATLAEEMMDNDDDDDD